MPGWFANVAAQAEKERAQRVKDRADWKAGGGMFGNAAETTVFQSLGVIVKAGDVWTGSVGTKHHRLGRVADAAAQVTDGVKVHRVGAGVAGVLLTGGLIGAVPALTRKSRAVAFVVFADGTAHEHPVNGNGPVRRAQAEVVRFNALAAAAQQERIVRDEDMAAWRALQDEDDRDA